MNQEESRTEFRGVDVVESYRDYTPRRSYTPYVCDLLKCVPKRYLAGLDRVVLTDAAGQPRRERRRKTRSRKRRVPLIEARGFYQRAWRGNRAFIQLYVDRIFHKAENRRTPYERLTAPMLWPIIRPAFIRVNLAFVLYHEIGHHIHAEQRPEYRERENVANTYRRRLVMRLLLLRWYFVVPACLALMVLPEIWRITGRFFFGSQKRSSRSSKS
ncbi:MAG: hypothetical protein IT364_11130 [Candidatus Hydrogenedentes bacterium]|nr:hypothetical protein [Candidatus Hydrogenedentota bacterium]